MMTNDDETGPTIVCPIAPELPRVWPVFVVSAIAMVVIIGTQIAAVLVLVVWYVAHGADVKTVLAELPEKVATPIGVLTLGLLSQLIIALAALIPARLSPQSTLVRVGLVRPTVPLWSLPIIMIGALFTLAVGVTFAHLLTFVIEPDKSAEMIYRQMTLPWALPFLAFISLAPGFAEELLFRGYIQGRLLQRWPAWLAILTATTLFALFHITPHSVVNAFVIGLWLGVLAWRTGSVWSGILCHAFINATWTVWQLGIRLGGWPETPPLEVSIAAGVIITGCFAWSLWLIGQRPKVLDLLPRT